MAYYRIKVLYKGESNTYTLQSQNKKEALRKAKLKHSNAIVLRIDEIPPPLIEQIKKIHSRLIRLPNVKIKRQDLIAVIQQLAVMTNAGIPLYQALLDIAQNSTNRSLRIMLLDVAEHINAGISLSQALAKYHHQVGSLTLTLIRLGERTGDMHHAFVTLVYLLEKIDQNIKKFKKAIRYPLLTISAIIVAFIILITYTVPKFKAIFDRFHAELPLPTKILLGIEDFLHHYGLIILFFFLSLLTISWYSYKYSTKAKEFFDTLFLRIYLIKDIIYYAQIHRFLMVLAELTTAGIPILEALEDATNMVDNAVIRKKLSWVIQRVQKGTPVAQAFAETELFENMIIQMIRAGENSGQLDSMLRKAAEYYEMKFNHILDNLSSYIEPILLALIAGMVLVLALGIFLPMWDMAKVVQGH